MRTVETHTDEVRRLLAPLVEGIRAAAPEILDTRAPELSHRVTARALHGAFSMPPFDNSQMDGYAVRAEELAGADDENPVRLRLGLATAAGDPPGKHLPGTASPVMTGAAIPEGADAVVPVEATRPPRFPELERACDSPGDGAARETSIDFIAPVLPGTFVRRCGEDLAEGDEIVPAGSRLVPARIGALAAAGIAEVPVRPRTRVLLCSTGDELTQPEPQGPPAPLPPGRIHDANTPMLAAALRGAGASVRTIRCADHPEALRELLAVEAAGTDLLVTSGGISAGAFEVVREALGDFGAEFTSVAMQPGGPQGLGALRLPDASAPLPALCFPGNPVSALLSAELFLLPTLRELAAFPSDRRIDTRTLAHDVHSPEHKLQLRRGRIASDGRVAVTAPGSHLLGDLAAAEVIVQLPVGLAFAPENTPVDVWSLT